MTASSPFEHEVIPRLTKFCVPPEQADTTIQELYAGLVDDTARNELIVRDLLRAVQDGCSPLLLTARTEHLKFFETALDGRVANVFVLKGGMGKKQGGQSRMQLRQFQRAIQESSWQREVTSERALTMLASIPCFWQCPFHGRVRCSSMLGAFIGFTMRSALSGFTTMSIPMSSCWQGCTRAD
jgi:hypothetical protein